MTSPLELATAPLQGVLVNLVQLDDSVLEPYLEMLSDPEGRRLTATKEVFSRTQILEWLTSRPSALGRSDWAKPDDSQLIDATQAFYVVGLGDSGLKGAMGAVLV